jgi:hypothetical protein
LRAEKTSPMVWAFRYENAGDFIGNSSSPICYGSVLEKNILTIL